MYGHGHYSRPYLVLFQMLRTSYQSRRCRSRRPHRPKSSLPNRKFPKGLSGHTTILLINLSSFDIYRPRRRPLFGLVIGIDNYQSPEISDLSGAVADSTAIYGFISANRHAFSPHITHLTNEQATRGDITRELEALCSNPLIQRDDPIFIYYAGHGGSAARTNVHGQSDASNIQFIVPYDCGEFVEPISYRDFVGYMNRLADTKGNNIVSYSVYVSREGISRFISKSLFLWLSYRRWCSIVVGGPSPQAIGIHVAVEPTFRLSPIPIPISTSTSGHSHPAEGIDALVEQKSHLRSRIKGSTLIC